VPPAHTIKKAIIKAGAMERKRRASPSHGKNFVIIFAEKAKMYAKVFDLICAASRAPVKGLLSA